MHPGILKSPYSLGFLGIFHTITMFHQQKRSLSDHFDRHFSAVLLVFAKAIVCEMGNRVKDGYAVRYNGYVARYEKAKARSDRLTAEREERLAKAAAIDQFIETITAKDRLIAEFDSGLWLAVLEKAIVHEDGTIVFRFYNGTEITR